MEASELFRKGFFMASGCLTAYAMFESFQTLRK